MGQKQKVFTARPVVRHIHKRSMVARHSGDSAHRNAQVALNIDVEHVREVTFVENQ